MFEKDVDTFLAAQEEAGALYNPFRSDGSIPPGTLTNAANVIARLCANRLSPRTSPEWVREVCREIFSECGYVVLDNLLKSKTPDRLPEGIPIEHLCNKSS